MKLERQGEDYVLRVSRDELGHIYSALLNALRLIADSEYQTITGHEKTEVEQFFPPVVGVRSVDEIEIRPWRIAYEREATIRAYERVPRGGAEERGGQSCRNLAAARSQTY